MMFTFLITFTNSNSASKLIRKETSILPRLHRFGVEGVVSKRFFPTTALSLKLAQMVTVFTRSALGSVLPAVLELDQTVKLPQGKMKGLGSPAARSTIMSRKTGLHSSA
jgi:L-fucose mutarotase/ribose pyranase (RbsD/FucU family)